MVETSHFNCDKAKVRQLPLPLKMEHVRGTAPCNVCNLQIIREIEGAASTVCITANALSRTGGKVTVDELWNVVIKASQDAVKRHKEQRELLEKNCAAGGTDLDTASAKAAQYFRRYWFDQAMHFKPYALEGSDENIRASESLANALAALKEMFGSAKAASGDSSSTEQADPTAT